MLGVLSCNSGHDVIEHLSSECPCGSLLDWHEPNTDQIEFHFEDEYNDASGPVQDSKCNFVIRVQQFLFDHVPASVFDDPIGEWHGSFDNDSGAGILTNDMDSDTHQTPSDLHPIPLSRARVYHPNKSQSVPGGMNLLQCMDQDEYVHIRDMENIYYPFASKSDWEVANWLSSGPLTQKEIDAFLHLERVRIFIHCNKWSLTGL